VPYSWSEKHVSQADGSWTNEADGKNDWKGISVFRTIALGEALHYHGAGLSGSEKKQWTERLRKGGDYVLNHIGFETGDINYPNSAAAALAVCWQVLGDEKYLIRAREMANFGLQHFTVNNLIWGEGIRELADTTATGLRPIDIPYNITESLPNLALYATITNDEKVLQAVVKSLQAHLNFVIPDGALDAGWCSRMYKWNYFGSSTADGIAGGCALLSKYDKRFAEAAYRNVSLMQSYTHNGILYGGPDLYKRKLPATSHHTIASAKGLTSALDAGVEDLPATFLPNDKAYGIREWKEARVVQVGIGGWRASITTNDIATSKKRGNHPMGGALTMLWHQQTGPVAVASMNEYIMYEPSNMQTAKNADEKFSITPRIEITSNGNRFSNVYDDKAVLSWTKKGNSIMVKIKGSLKNAQGYTLPGILSAFEINYTFNDKSFEMAAQCDAADAKLLFPIIPFDKGGGNKNGVEIYKAPGSIKIAIAKTNVGKAITGKKVFNYVPGFEAVVVENTVAKIKK